MSMFIFFVQQILLFATPLIVAGIGGMFCERGGIINIGVEGMMIIGAFCGCLFLHFVPAGMPSQLQLIVALLIAAAAGVSLPCCTPWPPSTSAPTRPSAASP